MKSKMLARKTGPWIYWGPIRNYAALGMWAAVKLVCDPLNGVFLNIAVVKLGTLVLGWMPNHRKAGCLTGFGVVYLNGEEPKIEHHCWARKFNYEAELRT
jgi:hypothetical protein